MKILMCLNLLANDPQFNQIRKNHPTLEESYAKRVSCYSRYVCSKYNIDCKAFIAIMMAESSYRLDAYNTLSKDYGICQVNKFNIKAYGFSKHRLMTDLKYSIEAGAKVFAWFSSRYERDEAIMRYNVGTRPSAIKRSKAKQYLEKVNKFLH